VAGGDFPATNLQQARQFVPGFQLSKGRPEKRQAEEKRENGRAGEKSEADEKKGGEILLIVKNVTP